MKVKEISVDCIMKRASLNKAYFYLNLPSRSRKKKKIIDFV